MITTFPKYISNKAVIIYFVLLVIVPAFFGYPMEEWFSYVWGIIEVLIFFYFCRRLVISSGPSNPKYFERKIFWIALIVRVLYVFISYWFYSELSDVPPFEFGALDSKNYDSAALGCVTYIQNGVSWANLNDFFDRGLDDLGYMYYLTLIYLLTDHSIIIARLVNAVLSAFTVLYVYKVANRHFEENVAKLSAVFCALMPTLIFYCGLHLKEPVMVFLTAAFINSADSIIIEKGKWTKWIPMVLAGLALFTFRTVLGAVAFLSFFATLLFSSGKTMSWSKRIIVSIAAVGMVSLVIGEKIMSEIQEVVDDRGESQRISMEWRAKREGGNKFAKYAGAAVFAPLIFTIPFPTLVNTPDQENQRLLNGGNYDKNIMSFFTIAALVLLLTSGNWRKHVLILSFTVGYVVVLVFSSFAQSERFHQPVLPFEMMLAAYGISLMQTRRGKRFFNGWLCLMFVAIMAWQWFKLAGRDMI